MSNHVGRVSQATLTLATRTVAGFNFLALMITAIYVNRVAAALIVVGRRGHVPAAPADDAGGQAPVESEHAANVDYVSLVVGERHAGPGGAHLQRRPAAHRPGRPFGEKASDLTFRTRLLALVMPALYQNISIGLVIAGMAVVYAVGRSGVTDLGGGRAAARAGPVLQPAAADELPLPGRGRARTWRSSTSARRSYVASVEPER